MVDCVCRRCGFCCAGERGGEVWGGAKEKKKCGFSGCENKHTLLLWMLFSLPQEVLSIFLAITPRITGRYNRADAKLRDLHSVLFSPVWLNKGAPVKSQDGFRLEIYAELLEMHRDFPVRSRQRSEACKRGGCTRSGVGRPCTPPTVHEAAGVPRGREWCDRSPGR